MAKQLRNGFDISVILIAWMIWKERNARVFNNKRLTAVALLENIHSEQQLWRRAAFFRAPGSNGSE